MEAIKGCRICGEKYNQVLDLGELYPSTYTDGIGHYHKDPAQIKAPLTLVQCRRCGLVQLKHTVDLDSMYRQYWYKSGLNDSMIEALQDIVDEVQKRVKLAPGDVVIDIGANDGTMLAMYPRYVTKIGIDPALNLADEAKANCDYFINDYFSAAAVPKRYPMAKVITSIAMFYDLPNPVSFVDNVKQVLSPDGIWVIQLTDLTCMLETNAFDNICHEHLEYYSLDVIADLLYKQGLEVFDISYNSVNGQSVRLYVSRVGYRKVQPQVKKAFEAERRYLQEFRDPFREFAKRVEQIRTVVQGFFEKHKDDVIYAMGASTKGNTLLQYFQLNNKHIDCAVEVSPEKYGKYTVGTEIQIVPQDDVPNKLTYPDYYFILPWHFTDNFVGKNRSFLEQGGRFFVPMPWPCEIYLKDGEEIWEWRERPSES